MSQVNKLIAKAMSTTSDSEAMNCLMMARKKANSIEIDDTDSDKLVSKWRGRAQALYTEKRYYMNMSKEWRINYYIAFKDRKNLREKLRYYKISYAITLFCCFSLTLTILLT